MKASMKKCLIGLCVISSLAVAAQAQNFGGRGQMMSNGGGGGYALQNLNLSAEQQQKIDALRLGRTMNMTFDQRQKLRAEHQARIQTLLTPQQKAIYEAQINNRGAGRGMGQGMGRNFNNNTNRGMGQGMGPGMGMGRNSRW